MTYRNLLLAGVASCALLSACGTSSDDLRETLGLNHKAPDEYQVYSRPALIVPPEFNLQAPNPNAHGRGDYAAGVPASDDAHNKILGDAAPAAPTPMPGISAQAPSSGLAAAVPSVSSAELPSATDSQFLSDAGSLHADPHIRERIEDDKLNGVAPKDDTYLLGAKKTDDTQVDASKEAKRIADDKAQDKPITTGDTPVIQPKDKGILGDIF